MSAASRVVKMDDSGADGIRLFRAKLAGTIGKVPSISLTVRIMLGICTEHYDRSESLIRRIVAESDS